MIYPFGKIHNVMFLPNISVMMLMCIAKFGTSGDALQSKLGKIRFSHVLACVIERKIIYDLPKKPKSKSCIMEVLNSTYLANYCHQRWLCDITPQELICYRHFLVHSHDHQVSILAKNYHAKVVKVGKKTKRIAKILA